MKVFKKLFLPIAALAAFVGTSQAMEKKSYKYFEQPEIEQIKFTPVIIFSRNMVDEATKQILNKKTNRYSSLSVNQLPDNIAAIINKYSKCTDETKILEEENLVLKRVALENLGIGMSRIIRAQLINRCAKEHNLSIRATEQKSYLDPNGAFWVIAPKIKPSTKPFSRTQIKDLYKLAKLTGYAGDLHAANIFNTEEGHAFAVDTEEKSFLDYDISDSDISDLRRRFSTFTMEPDAQQWIDAKLTKIEAKQAQAHEQTKDIQSQTESNQLLSSSSFKVEKATAYARLQTQKAAEAQLKAQIAANEARLKESIQHRTQLSLREDSLKDACGIS